jgi:hypothetical protein
MKKNKIWRDIRGEPGSAPKIKRGQDRNPAPF